MEIHNWAQLSSKQQQLCLQRPALANTKSLGKTVSEIINSVKTQGDEAVLKLTHQFDCAELTELKLDPELIDSAENELSGTVKQAIDLAYKQINSFHQAQVQKDISIETCAGVLCELRHQAINSVGLYIPGGTAPLPSTVLMLGIPAQIAGCKNKVLCTPPNQLGQIKAEIRYAAKKCGIEQIFLCGGAQAIAAMAFGTEAIPQVDKIFGPGNSFVTEAKQQVTQVAGGAAIDMPAGPSEVLVIADSNASPAFVASDMLSQAEHGKDSQSVLISTSINVIKACQQQITDQLERLPRKDIATIAISHSRFILVADLNQAVKVSNAYAPEHLIIQTDKPRQVLKNVENAASIFLGKWSPESAGDYASGTNHVLPTYGYARNYSSLGLADFCKRFTIQELTREGLHNIGNEIVTLAQAEGLDAHANAVSIRLGATDSI